MGPISREGNGNEEGRGGEGEAKGRKEVWAKARDHPPKPGRAVRGWGGQGARKKGARVGHALGFRERFQVCFRVARRWWGGVLGKAGREGV